MSGWHVAIVGLTGRQTAALTTRIEAHGWRASRRLCTEGVIGALANNPANVYVTAVRMPAEPLQVMMHWIRKSDATRSAIVIAVARNREEEREAGRAGADYVLRAPLLAGSLADDVITRIAIEAAVAGSSSHPTARVA